MTCGKLLLLLYNISFFCYIPLPRNTYSRILKLLMLGQQLYFKLKFIVLTKGAYF
jgi:hypothetical protein